MLLLLLLLLWILQSLSVLGGWRQGLQGEGSSPGGGQLSSAEEAGNMAEHLPTGGVYTRCRNGGKTLQHAHHNNITADSITMHGISTGYSIGMSLIIS